ncbi:MAG: hypothetical protein KF852_17300 [Saprospiraceae bacterium]|nr:hypothetical protein [Saprospiraceae bacterium]
MKLKSFLSNLFGPSRDQLERHVASLIAEGKIAEAVQMLMDAGYAEAAVLKARWDMLHAEQEKRHLPWETFSMEQNRILYALLDMTKPPEARAKPEQAEGIEHGAKGIRNPKQAEGTGTPEPPKLSQEQRVQLRQLLEQSQWQQALELGKDWSNELMLTYGRYQGLERNFSLGLLTEANYQNTKKQILDALHYFASENQ